ncbi:MAG: TIGR00180 family glycosyltransferase [Candidatus Omnitrophica bacterium]|nr:TIGR00180 family glycosyltransferase [Candidatus Omnitrophota bacterium]
MLTVLIATRHRFPYLRRLLSYYAGQNLPFGIMIGDSSAPSEQGKTAEMVSGFKGRLKLSYQVFPESFGNYPVCDSLLRGVETPYAAILADDDFLTPRVLREGVGFLERHPDYSVVHGEGALIRLKGPGTYGEVDWIERYPQCSAEREKASERLERYFAKHPVSFSIRRTRSLREDLRKAGELQLDWEFSELLTGALALVEGKSKKLDLLALVRQVHPDQASVRTSRSKDFFDWVMDPLWHERFSRLCRCLSETLSQKEGVSQGEALEVVRRVFWLYLANGLNSGWRARYGDPPLSRFRGVPREISGLRDLVYGVRSVLPSGKRELSLSALRKASHSYHIDFVPVYQAITSGSLNGNGDES